MTKWEYRWFHEDADLNAAGADGWELFAFYDGMGLAKRPVVPVPTFASNVCLLGGAVEIERHKEHGLVRATCQQGAKHCCTVWLNTLDQVCEAWNSMAGRFGS